MSGPAPASISRVKIFPPIGIARVGDSGFDLDTGKPDLDTLEYFLPSEIPGNDSLENGFTFREESAQWNGHKRIKRQAVRFRVYAYDKDGTNLGEITAGGGYKLTWTVHVANHKASFEIDRSMYMPSTGKLRNPDIQGGRKPEHRDKLIVDPGPKTLSSLDTNAIVNISGKFHGSQAKGVDVHLGQLRTNRQGHLIFIGGAGYALCVINPKFAQPDIVSPYDSADWIDDICDGWVKVLIDHDDLNSAIESSKATVLSAPPKFAWGVRSPTALYDLIADIYAKQPGGRKWQDDQGKGVNFNRDIWPVVEGTYATSWTSMHAFEGHGVLGKANYLAIKDKLKSMAQENKAYRQAIFNRLRAPDYKVLAHASIRYMPRLSGNAGDAIEPGTNLPPESSIPLIQRYAALTALQYERFLLWKDGKFKIDELPWGNESILEKVPPRHQPACLTLAALNHAVGESLWPGMEVYWIAREHSTYVLEVDTDKDHIDPPFRVDHDVMAPGYLTRGLSLPWQSDFDLCNVHWWPTARPHDVIDERDFTESSFSETEFIDEVLPKRKRWSRGIRISLSNDIGNDDAGYYPGSTDMVKYWSRLGFVVKHKTKMIARGTQRDPVWLETEREKIVRKDNQAHLPFNFAL